MRLDVPAASMSPEINFFISTHSIYLRTTSTWRANAIALWLAVETLLAANPAEYKSLPIVCGRMSRPSDLDGHTTHGVHNFRVRHRVGRRDNSSCFVHSLANVTTPELEDLSHETATNLRGCHGSKLQSGRTLDTLQKLWLYALIAQILEDRCGSFATGDQ